MAKATRICSVCGKEYEYCHTFRHDNPFRWQDVACCPEHGSIYFQKILESRGQTVSVTEPQSEVKESVNEEKAPAKKRARTTASKTRTVTE